MPELPEVETIRRDLETLLVGKKIAGVEIYYSGSVKIPSAARLRQELPGRKITGVGRRGKYLQIFLHDASVLIIHLRMTGQLLFAKNVFQPDKHTHVIFIFSDSSSLAFHDVRKFGTIYWLPSHSLQLIKGLASLGPEPFAAEFNESYLFERAKNRKTSIKALLLNQEIVAGLGNIYADESLHRAGIRPDRPAASLTLNECKILCQSICEVLEEAIYWRGTTMSDYRDAAGSSGAFQNHLRVYKQSGKECPRCGQEICRIVVAGRGTHYCPACQK
ncbi:MAG: DNA-formamidopyrimidine glycosylase [Firmicutes bacterium]|nr:DNA-formamidopyrimidine glycosylase [Bacillota bacterium]